MTRSILSLSRVAAVVLVATGVSAQQGPPDIILSNGKIITVDDRFTIAQAVAVRGDRIVAVGTNRRSRAWRARTRGASTCAAARWSRA